MRTLNRQGSAPSVLRPPDRRPASATAHVVGFALIFIAAGLVVCGVIEATTGGPAVGDLIVAGTASASLGGLLWRYTRTPDRISAASAFAAVAWTWIAMSVVGGIPFWTSGMLADPLNALFESVSGFTGTGASVLSPISENGRGLLMWRQATQWYGGLGVIVLAVAVLPLLGVGGYELLRAEGPGPTSDRLAPRVSDTAKRLWIVYLALTVVIALALLAGGMSLYDAIAHSMTTVATGGFSPYDASIAAFDSLVIEVILIASMAAGAISFALWWQVLTRRSLRDLTRSSELKVFLAIGASATVFMAVLLVLDGARPARASRDAAFAAMTAVSTTGFGTADFAAWPAASQLVILAMMITGGMAGSTSGAVKLFRIQVMAVHTRRELRRVVHPRGVLPVKIGGNAVPEDIVQRIVGFFIFYIGVTAAGAVILTALGSDLVTSASAVITSIGGVGPGLGEVGPHSNFLAIGRPSRAVLIVYMLLGRLELFTLLLMFAAPWRAVADRMRRG